MHPKLLATALAIAVAHDISSQIKHRKARQTLIDILETQENAANENLAAAGKQIIYLVGVLNENGVMLDDFDLLALNFHTLSK